ncbi:hypothetical protein LPB248_09840 [Flavobacterium sp. LPB0248]|uniref:hypothetical protein n=1 Tax=Flavobacterium sp. LPB0248 TaxID=2614441 RepID=UPI0015A6348F|nr:hypothetical protein [Flavobacterium sp. LPB0248]QLC66575.1 hypothetical protein LPB248_09840 [Flavobacterium sp. LPB0248]
MLKKILKLEGAQELTRDQQRLIKGGIACGAGHPPCKSGFHCVIPDGGEGYCKSN